jgi:hypothetical protein
MRLNSPACIWSFPDGMHFGRTRSVMAKTMLFGKPSQWDRSQCQMVINFGYSVEAITCCRSYLLLSPMVIVQRFGIRWLPIHVWRIQPIQRLGGLMTMWLWWVPIKNVIKNPGLLALSKSRPATHLLLTSCRLSSLFIFSILLACVSCGSIHPSAW